MKSVIKPVDLKLRPEQVFEKIQQKLPCFWLDSAMLHPERGLWAYLGFNPFLRLRFKNSLFEIKGMRQEKFMARNPLKVLRDYFSRWRVGHSDPNFPLLGGGIGYLGYELGNYLERIPFTRKDDLNLSELCLNLYQFVLGFHHSTESWYLLGIEGEGLPEKAESFQDQLIRVLEQDPEHEELEFFSKEVQSNFSKEEYQRALLRAKKYIRAGEIYQVNLTQRFFSEYQGSAFRLYQRLRHFNPGCYAGILREPDFSLLSSSPELFLRVREREVITRPIKGTRARGKNSEEDENLKAELLKSEKDLAELAMIVDLERNDLGRVCDYGSVQVLGYPELETYSRVHHLIATVSGRLAKNRDLFDLLRATFPGGSITGAPKKRAMEIIDELEPNVRGPYTGSIGWLSFSGNLELNIAIRIIILKDNKAYFPAGGGIVFDSEPELEYQESWTKALALWEALSGKKYLKPSF